jgi:aminoglycoside phosphotransferase (APT) family kinase protein
MTQPWAADIDVTVDLARALLAEQFPQFARAALFPLGEGWDNAAYLVDDAYVFRFPRREIAAPLITREIAILPQIAKSLPLPISAPAFAGTPSPAYPWPFAGYERLPGAEMSSMQLDLAACHRLATALGGFLRALHAIDPSPLRGLGLPADEIGRLDHAQRMPKMEDRLGELQAGGLISNARRFLDALEDVSPAGPRPDRLTVVHGDLYAKHVMIDCDRVAGIIDWGDVHYGDPAIDVSVVFELLPQPARETFAKAYGSIDDETLRLARYRAVYHAALVAHYGYRIGNSELLDAGIAGLTHALS